MSLAFKPSEVRTEIMELVREGNSTVKKWAREVMDTPIAHTLLKVPLAISLHPKVSGREKFDRGGGKESCRRSEATTAHFELMIEHN